MTSTLIGGLLGGIFRLLPEILKYLDARNERKHELAMQEKAIEFQRLKGDQRMEEISAQGQQDWNVGALETLRTALQGQDTPSGVKWIDGLSKLMRPLITIQWVVFLYPAVIVCGFIVLVQSGVSVLQALPAVFGPEEKALVAGILNFWFLGRVFDRVR
jgi:hypothetical protein